MRATQPPLHDAESFSDLYQRTRNIIYRFIYGLHGGPSEDVEDITCDTFMRAWNGRDRFHGDGHDALCWLFTIARHLVIDEHRRDKTRPQNTYLDDANIEAIFLSNQVSPEEQAGNCEQYRHLWQIMQNLPDNKREILILRYVLGWKVIQIAKYLHKEDNTVTVYIRRCLEQIRQDWSMDEP